MSEVFRVTRGTIWSWKPSVHRGPFVWGVAWGYWWLRFSTDHPDDCTCIICEPD